MFPNAQTVALHIAVSMRRQNITRCRVSSRTLSKFFERDKITASFYLKVKNVLEDYGYSLAESDSHFVILKISSLDGAPSLNYQKIKEDDASLFDELGLEVYVNKEEIDD